MTMRLAGALVAGSVWLLGTVLAWPAGPTTAAVALLAAQAGLCAVLAVRRPTIGAPPINVGIRRRGSQ